MKQLPLALLLTLLTATLILPAPATGEARTTLTGEYYWKHANTSGDLRATFLPTGEGTWAVDFHFIFDGVGHIYSGTAEGKLGSGALSGQVFNENRRRTFTFEGSFTDGHFDGTHAELKRGRSIDMGTLTLDL
jgi:hypothetical protein